MANNTPILEGIYFNHPSRGQTQVAVDTGVLRRAGHVYADGEALQQALTMYGPRVQPVERAVRYIGERMNRGLVWGCSGYAMDEPDYARERNGIKTVYDFLEKTNRRPSLVVDGGVRDGVLDISAKTARDQGISTLGYLPLQGLATGIGLRDHLVVKGDTYRDREAFVGVTPSVLLCVGGSEGTRREYQRALEAGNFVLHLMLKPYGDDPKTIAQDFRRSEDGVSVERDGQLVMCQAYKGDPTEHIEQAIDQLFGSLAHAPQRQRNRLQGIEQTLLS